MDGLDEVANDTLHRRVVENLFVFISSYTPKRLEIGHFNRFILTSRIVGYEAGSFAQFAHYTLQDLEEEQIKEFLSNWCPAIERYQSLFAQGMKSLTVQQRGQANREGMAQKERLLDVLQNNPGVKRLAANPLMLTLLALIQRSGKSLPHRRIDLYQVATRTLLDNWNQYTGRSLFSQDEIPLVEHLLSDLAYYAHTHEPLLTEEDVKTVICDTISAFPDHSIELLNKDGIQQFINTVRKSSGLFVESGQGLFSFMHRTFQEYFVAGYLLRRSTGELKQFVLEKYRLSIWHEPLLLAIAYKSGQPSRREWQDASELIRTILDDQKNYDAFLHRSLLFSARCMGDCNTWSIDTSLQRDIATRLLDLYGDSFGAGRYTALRKDIAEAALLWLRGQPQGKGIEDIWPPLLETWHAALCDAKNQRRQEGAAHLLSAIALELSSCPKIVLSALVPPLLRLSRLQDVPYPAEVVQQVERAGAESSSVKVEDYAFVTLRLLDASGPAGWLRDAWLQWDRENPMLLERLAQHSRAFWGDSVTLVAFPGKADSPDWSRQVQIVERWARYGDDRPREKQVQLLKAGSAARFPHAYLYKRLLDQETASQLASPSNLAWHVAWDNFLLEEMRRGRSATYQICLNMRATHMLLTYMQRRKGEIEQFRKTIPKRKIIDAHGGVAYTYRLVNEEILEENYDHVEGAKALTEQQGKDLINELMVGLSARGPRQVQALIAISTIYLQFLFHLSILTHLRDYIDTRDLIGYLDARDLFPAEELRVLYSAAFTIEDVGSQLDLSSQRSKQQEFNWGGIREVFQTLLDCNHIVDVLCRLLVYRTDAPTSLVLLALYSILYNSSERASGYRPSDRQRVSATKQRLVRHSIKRLEQRTKSLNAEERLLGDAILHLLSNSIAVSTIHTEKLDQTPEVRSTALRALESQPCFTKSQVEDLLAACTDTREIDYKSEDINERLRIRTVRDVVLKLFSRRIDLEAEAFPVVLEALDSKNTFVCVGAAMLLQKSKALPLSIRLAASQKIMAILTDEIASRRPFDTPIDHTIWRLDDLLFETLKGLVD